MTGHGGWFGNRLYWTLITRICRFHESTHYSSLYWSTHNVFYVFTRRCFKFLLLRCSRPHWLQLACNKLNWLLNFCWSSPAQLFLVSNHRGLITIFYCLTALEAFRLLANHSFGRLDCSWPSPAVIPSFQSLSYNMYERGMAYITVPSEINL